MTASPPEGERRPRKKRRPARRRLPLYLGLAFAVHPVRAGLLAGLGLLLTVFVATTSLPMALAEPYPRLALLLHPNHPQALLTLAREERQALLALTPDDGTDVGNGPTGQGGADPAATDATTADMGPTDMGPADTSTADTAPAGAEAHVDPLADTPPEGDPAEATAPTPTATPAEIEARRATIRDLASRIIAQAPLNAAAYRLLGDASDDPDIRRQAMIDAVARSRRETVAVFWLLQHDYAAKDYAGAVAMADALMRTRPALARFTLSYLYSLVLTPEGREALAVALAQDPSWRARFFAAMGQSLAASDDPLQLFALLKAAGSPPTESELTPFLRRRMASDGHAVAAYNIWLQMLSDEQVLDVRPVNNLDFSKDAGELPFGWNVPRSVNAFVDFVSRPTGESGRILRVRFGVGQVKFGPVGQIALLRPGTYRFEGEQKGAMASKRGMRWQVACYPSNQVIGQSDQLLGSPRQWREFDFTFTIPETGTCSTQRIRLVHDARTPSEQFASGEILFQSLDIQPVRTPTSDLPG
ncbi:hypothetical protein [Ancylobacter sp. TS-1]|uniref:hypothetical protein n=1 Tax=Ancylobacter sp. TS-1 TaxID=1850374 RepID=UPI001265C82D|nr:hypothetical protein [Ancylobacter sp. TS-1]QFR33448.1 hypothetical protein GBB76_10070 [Ancylobacter sp. TS-1]